MKVYVCKHCGNMIEMVKDAGVNPVCCGEKMVEIVANTVDAAKEKHVPVYSIDGGKVSVNIGSVEHPMIAEHFIEWITVETNQGISRKNLNPGEKPAAVFALAEGETVQAVYAYCNLHGLWKA